MKTWLFRALVAGVAMTGAVALALGAGGVTPGPSLSNGSHFISDNNDAGLQVLAPIVALPDGSVVLRGNRAAANTGQADIVLDTLQTRTTGSLLEVDNHDQNYRN